MSLEKAIEHKKEKRKPYYDSRQFDHSCRNHGSCPWCFRNRFYRRILIEKELDDQGRLERYTKDSPENGISST